MKTLYYFTCSFTGFLLADAEADTIPNQVFGCIFGLILFVYGIRGIITILTEKENKNGF